MFHNHCCRSLFRQSLDPMYIADLGGRIVDANRAWLEIFGYSESDLPSLRCSDVYSDASDQSECLEQGDGSINDVVRCRRKNKSEFLCRRSLVACRDAAARIVGYQGILQDITAQKRTEQALADELTRRRLLVDQSRDGIVVLDDRGGVVESNQKFASMLGYTMDEVGKLHVWDWDDSIPVPQLQEMLRTVDETGDHFETRHRRKDGTVYDVEIGTNGAIFSGRKLILCVCRDITARKRAENQLEQANLELRDLNARLYAAREEERERVYRELHDQVGQTLSAVKMDLEMMRQGATNHATGRTPAAIDRMDSLVDTCIARLRGVETNLMPAMLDDLGLTATIEWQVSEFSELTGIASHVQHLDTVPLRSAQASLAVFRAFQEALNNVTRHPQADAVEVGVRVHGSSATITVSDNGRGSTDKKAETVNMRERLRPFGGTVVVSETAGGETTTTIKVPVDN